VLCEGPEPRLPGRCPSHQPRPAPGTAALQHHQPAGTPALALSSSGVQPSSQLQREPQDTMGTKWSNLGPSPALALALTKGAPPPPEQHRLPEHCGCPLLPCSTPSPGPSAQAGWPGAIRKGDTVLIKCN